LNPLTIVDEIQRRADSTITVGFTLSGKPIHQIHRGGRLPRSSRPNIGKIDIVGAIESSSNAYFALLAGDVIERPSDLAQAARLFSYGTKTGIDLPGEIAGQIPEDIVDDRTGLYSMAIGQHSLVATPIQTAVMLSALANGGTVYKPKIISLIAGKGIHGDEHSQVECPPAEPIRHVFLPPSIREVLLSGMRQVIVGSRGTGRPSQIRSLQSRPSVKKDFAELQNYIVGKSSTAEVMERISLDVNHSSQIVKHIWFAAISFEKPILPAAPPKIASASFDNPELVVVVYLRYGDYGKEASPIAIQMIKKWREIKAKNGKQIGPFPAAER
jgi:cell division protein FtsI/penicillin-binding protein 2